MPASKKSRPRDPGPSQPPADRQPAVAVPAPAAAPGSRQRDLLLAIGLLVLWALLYLPNLRTSPNWYADEGMAMELGWTTAHGHPRLGALKHDFLVPVPYGPLYLFVNGVALRVFGNDIVVGRAVQTLIGLAGAGVLFWIGKRIRGSGFGFLCAASLLVYPEAVLHYRWVRMHPLTGVLALASVGFLLRYVQERRLRDVALAGVMCSLALACHVFAYPLAPVVVGTAIAVNWRPFVAGWRAGGRAMVVPVIHVVVAGAAAMAFAVLFALWFVLTQPGGVPHFLEQLATVGGNAAMQFRPGLVADLFRVYRNFLEFTFLTPTVYGQGTEVVDLWPTLALFGLFWFPAPKVRKWLLFWVLTVMLGVIKARSNMPIFFYPAMCFVPLLAIGVAGAIIRLHDGLGVAVPARWAFLRAAPAAVILGGFGLVSAAGSLGHLRSKIDLHTLHSSADAEAAMRFVNAHTGPGDYILMPEEFHWLYPHPYRANLIQAAHYAGWESRHYGTKTLPHTQFWFDCSWQKAKYVILAYGTDKDGRPYGHDAVFWLGFDGIRKIVEEIQKEKWPIAWRQGEFMVFANPLLAPVP